jgi:hypothetical protein
MDTQPHLLVCISGHGFGHVAQTAPVLNALHARIPNLQITVRTTAPITHLRSRIHCPFHYMRESGGDIGMLMHSALDVQVHQTASAYQQLHRDWGLTVSNEARSLREIAPDFVLSNVGYLALAGAHRAGIPCAGMSSLNWADVLDHYCGAISGTRQIVEQINLSYANAGAFLQLAPHMPMAHLENRVHIGPIAHVGRNRRKEIDEFFGLGEGEKLVLVSLGGFDSRLSTEQWPRIPGVRWLFPASWRSAHPDALILEALEMNFSDVLASCDTLICKLGYGSFAEAACNGVSVLYINREDWPETPYLAKWLDENGTCKGVARPKLESGDFFDELYDILDMPAQLPVAASGVAQAAEWLEQRLAR